MQGRGSHPPVCIQIISVIVAVSFGIYCILKGTTFGVFNWWYVGGIFCLVAGALVFFRIYEVCVQVAHKETALELSLHP